MGNLTVGGTGKTPMVLAIAERLAAGREARGDSDARVSRNRWHAGASGVPQSDEVALLRERLAGKVQLGVGADRYKSGMVLARHGIDWFVLDDGFQHLKLSRDVDVVLVDATDPFGGGTVLPAGRLREPLSALRRADIVVITRSVQAPSPAIEAIIRRHTSSPIFYASTRLESVLRVPQARRSLAAAGLAEGAISGVLRDWEPGRIFRGFAQLGIPGGSAAQLFRSSCVHGAGRRRELEQAASSCGADALLCTEKDVWNLRNVQFTALPVYCCRISFDLPEGFWSAVTDAMRREESGRGAMKILVRAPNWVGDAVMAIPALETIRRTHAGDEILHIGATCRCGSVFGTTVCGSNSAIRLSRTASRDGSGREKLVAELRKEKFDIAVLLQNAFEAAWLAWRAGIPERIGYARDARGPLLTKAIRVPQEGEIPKHESHYYLELLRRAGWIESFAGDPADSTCTFPTRRAQAAESALRSAGARENAWRCAIAPGASYGAAKCWPPERFALLADRLISECGADVIFFGTPGEKEIAARIRSNMKSARDFSGR